MNWTEEHDSVFCREIIFVNPFSAKKKSVQRSALWKKVADTLNGITDPVFYVDKRSVRDHIGVLVQRFKRKEVKELKESGTNPTKTEVDVATEQIIAMQESADEQHDLEDGEKKDKMEGDRLKAEEMRRTARETMGKTQIAVRMEYLRGGDWDEAQNGAHRVRSLLSISSLFSVVFMCLILPTLKLILGKSAKITKNEVSQDLMRFYSYEPLVETIL